MTDRNETKKFLYDTELSTPHKVLGDNYDEQLRAVLNYAPKLNVRKIKGFNECPIPEPPKPVEIKTYEYEVDGGVETFHDGFSVPAKAEIDLVKLGFPYTDTNKYDFEKKVPHTDSYITYNHLYTKPYYELYSNDEQILEGRVIDKQTKEIVAYVIVTLIYEMR